MALATVSALIALGAAGAGHEVPDQLRTVEVRSPRGVVVANTREAAEAGASILRAGGNAIDAAVATGLALGVVEPEASGVGGHAWILIRLGDGRTLAVDGSGRAPALATREAIQRRRERGDYIGHPTVAAPGSLAAYELCLRTLGTKSFAEVAAPAIALADEGVRLAPHQLAVLPNFLHRLRLSPAAAGIFLDPQLDAWPPDRVYCQDAYARTLRRLVERGVRDFYQGSIAAEIDADMRANDGYLRASDLAAHEAVVRAPLRGRYRDCQVLSFPAPGGGAAVIEALQILDRFPSSALVPGAPHRSELLIEAVRHATTDLLGLAPDALRQGRMIDPRHAAMRAASIRGSGRGLGQVPAHGARIPPGTTHFSVVDGLGNAVSVTQSFSAEFGSGSVTPSLGFLYNASLMVDNLWGLPADGIVPRHTVAPTIVVRRGRPLLVLGSAGSGRIASMIVNTIVNVVDARMPVADAVSAPRVMWEPESQRAKIELAGWQDEEEIARLERMGYAGTYVLHFPGRPIDVQYFGDVNTVWIDPTTGVPAGAGDARRFGAAAAGHVEDTPGP